MLDSLEEMEGVFFSHIFDAKAVNEYNKLDVVTLMAPEARCCGGFIISCLLETGAQEVVGKSA